MGKEILPLEMHTWFSQVCWTPLPLPANAPILLFKSPKPVAIPTSCDGEFRRLMFVCCEKEGFSAGCIDLVCQLLVLVWFYLCLLIWTQPLLARNWRFATLSAPASHVLAWPATTRNRGSSVPPLPTPMMEWLKVLVA